MNKTLSMLATALLATTIGVSTGASAGCGPFDARVRRIAGQQIQKGMPGLVSKTVGKKDERVRKDLEDIAGSVHCVRTTTTYEATRPSPDGKSTVTSRYDRVIHGTAFAYTKSGGFTYLVTNAHVADQPQMLGFSYKKVAEKTEIVDNARDKKPLDDVYLEQVNSDKTLDIAVLRTRKDLKVSKKFVFSPSTRARRGETAYIIGYPKALLKTQTKGIVAHPSWKYYDGERLDFLDVKATYGNSGSPYFVLRDDKLHWAGTVGKVWTYRRSSSTFMSLAYPIKMFKHLLDPRTNKR